MYSSACLANDRVAATNHLGDRSILDQPRADHDSEVLTNGASDAFQRLLRRTRATVLHPHYRRLSRAHPSGQLDLGQARIDAELVHQFAKRRDTGLILHDVTDPTSVRSRHRFPVRSLTHLDLLSVRALSNIAAMPALLCPPRDARSVVSWQTLSRARSPSRENPVRDPCWSSRSIRRIRNHRAARPSRPHDQRLHNSARARNLR
jgi:hypothetical protein